MKRPARLALAMLLASRASAGGLARADPPKLLPTSKISPYEQASIDAGVAKLGATIEADPQGKLLEGIDIITLDVFEPRDPLPGKLIPIANWFHATTRRYVIEREVLVSAGHAWDQALVDETARNLRGLPQLSLVLCVALKGSAPDRVRLLVITKDVWSLRLNNSFTFENGQLQYLLLQPTEENLVGSHQQVLATFVLDPGTVSVGGGYVIPRLDGSRVRAVVNANAVLNRFTGHPEGTNGSFNYGQPLYSTQAEWAWLFNIAWNRAIVRYFKGGEFTDFDPKTGVCAPLGRGVPRDDPAACRFNSDQLGGSYAVTRSWGSAWKHDLTLGVSASRNVYATFAPLPFPRGDVNAFETAALMPLSDTQIGPYVEYHDYSSRFVDVLDFETLALTENFRKGHELLVHVAPITTALRSSRNFINILAAAAYTVPLGDGLVRGVVQAVTDVSTDGTPPAGQGRIPDGNVEGALRVVSPRFGIGRLVFDAHVLDRYANFLRAETTLGGDTRLRGYPSADFAGKSFLSANFEYRSRPVELLSVDFAGAVFFDSGDAFDDFHKIFLKHGIGFGGRVEFPQLERVVLRVDWGFPLTVGNAPGLPAKSWPGDVVVTFGQAFGVPVVPTGN